MCGFFSESKAKIYFSTYLYNFSDWQCFKNSAHTMQVFASSCYSHNINVYILRTQIQFIYSMNFSNGAIQMLRYFCNRIFVGKFAVEPAKIRQNIPYMVNKWNICGTITIIFGLCKWWMYKIVQNHHHHHHQHQIYIYIESHKIVVFI